MGYRFIDHTADIAFEVWGKDVKELIENATLAFYDAFVHVEKLDKNRTVDLSIEAEEVDLLLYKWLNELLYLLDTEFFAAREVSVNASEFKVEGILIGSRVTREIVKVQPKAITMHNYRVEKEEGGYRTVIVVDI